MSALDPVPEDQPREMGFGDRVAGWVFLGILGVGVLALLAFVVSLQAGVETATLWAGGKVGTSGDGLVMGLVVVPILLIVHFVLEACGEVLSDGPGAAFSPRTADGLRVLLIIGFLVASVAWC